MRLFARLPAMVSRLYLWAAVLVGWVFFYHLDLGQALEFLGIMFGVKASAFSGPEVAIHFLNNAVFLLIAAVGCIPGHAVFGDRARGLTGEPGRIMRRPKCCRLNNMAVLILSIIFLVGQSYNLFLYFRF